MPTITRYRPVGANELELIRQSGFKKFPPRLSGQPIFYPVLNEEYVTQIARDCNAKNSASGTGYVTRFQVNASLLSAYQVRTVGSSIHQEYWIPANEPSDFSENIVATIEVIAEYRRQ